MAFHSPWTWTIKSIVLTIITICLRQNVLAARRVSSIDISQLSDELFIIFFRNLSRHYTRWQLGRDGSCDFNGQGLSRRLLCLWSMQYAAHGWSWKALLSARWTFVMSKLPFAENQLSQSHIDWTSSRELSVLELNRMNIWDRGMDGWIQTRKFPHKSINRLSIFCIFVSNRHTYLNALYRRRT